MRGCRLARLLMFPMIRVVSVETAGPDPAADRMDEVAVDGVDFERRSYRRICHSLVDPEIPIPPEASAVHNVTTAMVAGKTPPPTRIRPALKALAEPAIPFAAHKAAFDSAFLKPAVPAWTAPWIRTLRIARHLWPDAPSHGNQALSDRLNLNVPGNHPPNRAMGDAIATAALLVRQVESPGSVKRLLKLSRQPALQRRVPFGKRRGQRQRDEPLDHLLWASRQDWTIPTFRTPSTPRSAAHSQRPPPPKKTPGATP